MREKGGRRRGEDERGREREEERKRGGGRRGGKGVYVSMCMRVYVILCVVVCDRACG